MWYAGFVESLFEASATGRAMAKGRSLSQFQETFPDETSCAAFLLGRRWSKGFVRPGCGEQRAAALKSRAYTYECLDCGRQTSATAGTVMHRYQAAADDVVLGCASHRDTFQRHVGAAIGGSTRRHSQDRFFLAADAEIAPVDGRPGSRSLGGRRRGRSGGNSLPRRRRSPSSPGNAGKILVVGAVEVIDRDTNQLKPRPSSAPNTSIRAPAEYASL